MPDYLSEKNKKCLFSFLKLKIEEQNISELENTISIDNMQTCFHKNSHNIVKKSEINQLLVERFNLFDNIKQFKSKIGINLKIYQFEWIFVIHSFLELILL